MTTHGLNILIEHHKRERKTIQGITSQVVLDARTIMVTIPLMIRGMWGACSKDNEHDIVDSIERVNHDDIAGLEDLKSNIQETIMFSQ